MEALTFFTPLAVLIRMGKKAKRKTMTTFTENPYPEPHHEERGKGDLRRGVEGVDMRIEKRLGQTRPARGQPESHPQKERRAKPDGKGGQADQELPEEFTRAD